LTTIIVGIDPGTGGAIAFLEAETEQLLLVEDMPVDKTRVGKTDRLRIARSALFALLSRGAGAYGFSERPEARPISFRDKRTGQTQTRQPGAAGMFAFGESYGCIVMGCTCANIRLTEVRPSIWKKELSIPASKDDARRRAAELFPSFAQYFARVKDDGRAEAALIALYGARSLRGKASI
jgi:crossover junction endodeoxyribonuclease RuvC